VKRYVKNNTKITTQFEEKSTKAIINTNQVAMNLSEACDKATSSKFLQTNSRIDVIDKTLQEQEDEIQNLMDKISIYSQQKGQYASLHQTIPNCNDTTKLFPILKPMKHHNHQTQFLSNLEHITFSGDDILHLELSCGV
jgi:hypothetical protein